LIQSKTSRAKRAGICDTAKLEAKFTRLDGKRGFEARL
jgi:hypothetical protein